MDEKHKRRQIDRLFLVLQEAESIAMQCRRDMSAANSNADDIGRCVSLLLRMQAQISNQVAIRVSDVVNEVVDIEESKQRMEVTHAKD